MVFTADVITPDGIFYIKIARLIGDGNWKGVYEVGPYSAYPFVVLLFQKVLPDWETAGRMASAVAGSIAVVPFFLLLRRMFDRRIASVAAIFLVMSPRAVQYSSDVLREPLFWCFSITCLWAVWKGMEERKWTLIVLASIFAGLSLFTRIEGFALIGIVILWMAWTLLYQQRKVRLWFIFFLIFLVSCPVMSVAPLYLLKQKVGTWELGHAAMKIRYFLYKGASPLPSRAEGVSLNASAEPPLVAKAMGNRYVLSVWETFHKYFRSFPVALVVLLLFGVARRRIVPYSSKEVPILIWCLVFLSASLAYAFNYSYVSTRHGLLMGIPSLVWVSIGFWELSSRIEGVVGKTRWSLKLSGHVVVYFIVLICISMLAKTVLSPGDGKIEMKMAGIELKHMGYSDKRFAVEPRINRLTFYKGGEFVNIPVDIDYCALGRFLETTGASFLVVDERTIEDSVKGFKTHTNAINLERIEIPQFQGYREYSFVVYRIRK